MITKAPSRQEKTVAKVSFGFADLTDNTSMAAIATPDDAVVLGGLLVIDTLFNSATSDSFLVGDADSANRYLEMAASQAFTAAANDLLTTASDFAGILAVQVTTTPAAPAGLVSGTTYFALNIDATHIKLALTEGGDPIDLTTAGTGIFTLADASEVPAFTDEVFTPTQVAFEGATDNQITVGQDITAGTPLLFTVSKDLPAPLQEGVVYFVSRQGASTMKLLDAPGGAIINITDAGSGTHKVHPVLMALTPTGAANAKDVTLLWNGTGAAPTAGAGRLILEYLQTNRADFFQR
jgi:hypothetical protein